MKRITTLRGHSLGVPLLWLCAAAAYAQSSVGPAPKELDPKVVEAWQKAGAQVGWYRPKDEADWYAPAGGGLLWQFSEMKPNDLAALPVFRWPCYVPEVIVKLPAPAGPFALDFSSSGMTDAGLKELAALKNLQALNLCYTKVTDSGLKELAGLPTTSPSRSIATSCLVC